MGLLRFALSCFLLVFSTSILSADVKYTPRYFSVADRQKLALQHSLYQKVYADKVAEAVDVYNNYTDRTGKHDYELLHQLSNAVISRCAKKDNTHLQRLALVSAAYSHDESLAYLFDEAFASNDPLMQFLVLTLMAQQHDPALLDTLRRAAASPCPPLQVEAVSMLAEQGDRRAIRYVEAFLQKYPAELHCFFPAILAKINSSESHKMLRHLLHHSEKETILETIAAIRTERLTGLVPYLKQLAAHSALEVKEASLYCLASFGDASAVAILQRYKDASQQELATVAKIGLSMLLGEEYGPRFYSEALTGNPWSIDALSLVPGGATYLERLNHSNELPLRLNSAIRLLEAKRLPTMASLYEMFSPQQTGGIWLENKSAGKALKCYKYLNTSALAEELQHVAAAVAQRNRFRWLTLLRETSEESFLAVSDYLVSTRQAELIPAVFELIIAFPTEGGLSFAKQTLHYPGFPLLRYYSALVLAKSHIEDQHMRTLLEGQIREQWSKSIVQFREESEKKLNNFSTSHSYEIQPTDEAQLMLEGLETIASLGDDRAIAFFLEGMRKGHADNQTLFAAMLLRTTL